MSVYGGFSSRKHESLYGRLTEDMLSILCWRVMSALNKEEVNEEEWGLKFMSIYSQMMRLEQRKYHPPKYSNLCSDIQTFFIQKNRPLPPRRRQRSSITEDEVLGKSSKRFFKPLRHTSKHRDSSKKIFKPIGTSHMRRRSQHGQDLSNKFDLSLKFDQLKESVLRELFDYSVHHSKKMPK